MPGLRFTAFAFLCCACSTSQSESPRPATGGASAAGGVGAEGGAVSGGEGGASGDGQSAEAGAAGRGGVPGEAGAGNEYLCPRDVSSAGKLSPAWEKYAASPDDFANLPNVSYAGYQHGERELPSPSGPLVDVTEQGAIADDGQDDTAALRAAIESVEESGGVVYLPDGTYDLEGPLLVHGNGTILRGQSRAGTRLVFHASLAASYAVNIEPGSAQSRWSRAGGLVWFTPRSWNTYTESTSDIGATFDESWRLGPELASVTSEALRGQRSFDVDDASGLTAGEYVFVRVSSPADLSLLEHLSGDGGWARNYDWSSAGAARVLPSEVPDVLWPVRVEAIDGNSVTLHQPLRFDLRAEWDPTLVTMGDTIHESGIENMTLELERDYTWTTAESHAHEPGWNGPWFNGAVDCFLRAVTVIDPDVGLGVAASKNVTLSDFKLESSSAERSLYHHGTTMRMASHDVLFENFVIDNQPYHGINVEGFSMGGVWSDGQMAHGTFDTHRNLPLDCVHTQIVINNDASHGGYADAGPVMGARFGNWNIEVSNGRNHMIGEADIMPRGAIVGVRGIDIVEPGNSACLIEGSGQTGAVPNPPNLHRAALALRLCGGI
jgi:hypothetical protein